MTAHFLGGCPIGDRADTGVIDAYHRLYGHPGLHVVDGAAISANLGVNPSLTITAQAERAMAMWPNNGDPDPRPPLGDELPAARTGRATRPVRPAGGTGGPAPRRRQGVRRPASRRPTTSSAPPNNSEPPTAREHAMRGRGRPSLRGEASPSPPRTVESGSANDVAGVGDKAEPALTLLDACTTLA